MGRSFTDNGTTTSYVGKSTAVATGLPISIACFVKSTSLTNFPVVIQIDDGTNTNYVDLAIDGSGAIYAQSHSSGGGVNAKTTGPVVNGTWSHIAGVFASTTSRIVYFNGGGKVTNTTSSTPATFSRSTIGGDRTIGDGFNGVIAWLGIWNIALSDQDISCLGANNIHPLKIHPESLVACVDLIGASPETDHVSGTGWTVGGAGTTAYADSTIQIYFPRSPWKYVQVPVGSVSFAGTCTVKVTSASAPLTVSRPFTGTAIPKVTGSGAMTIGRTYGGTARAAVTGSGAFIVGRPFIPNQTLRIQASGSFTVIRITPIIPPSTGYYVFLENDGAYLSDLLTGGLDYSFRIQSIISGPYPDSGTAFQALWTFLNLPFPFANPLPPPPPGPWTNR